MIPAVTTTKKISKPLLMSRTLERTDTISLHATVLAECSVGPPLHLGPGPAVLLTIHWVHPTKTELEPRAKFVSRGRRAVGLNWARNSNVLVALVSTSVDIFRGLVWASDTNFRKNEKYVWGDSSRVPKKPCMAKFEQTPKFEPMKQKIVVYFIGQTDRHFEYPQLKLRIL